jgi:hypothetical protein
MRGCPNKQAKVVAVSVVIVPTTIKLSSRSEIVIVDLICCIQRKEKKRM